MNASASLNIESEVTAQATKDVLLSVQFRVQTGLWYTPNGDPLRLRVDKVRTGAAFEAAPMLKWRGG